MTDVDSANNEVKLILPTHSGANSDAESIDASDVPTPTGEAGRRTTLAPSLGAYDQRKSLAKHGFTLESFDDEIADFDIDQHKAWLLNPLPVGAYVNCNVMRERTGMTKLQRNYVFHTEDGLLLAVAKKVGGIKKRPYWSITTSSSDSKVHGKSYVGKLRWNTVGSEFTAYGEGENKKSTPKNTPTSGFRKIFSSPSAAGNKKKKAPTDAAISATVGSVDPLSVTAKDEEETEEDGVREEFCFIMYNVPDCDGNYVPNGPRSFRIAIPYISPSGERTVCRPVSESDRGLKEMSAMRRMDGAMIEMRNLPAKYDETRGTYALDFTNRVEESSVKNFQLINPLESRSKVYLQFGRVDENNFSCDFGHPLSPYQAFCIALSSLDYKMCTV